MKIIEKVEIKNFRSFGNRKQENFELVKLQDVNIISGANDSGKSNILRALNLFFNKHTNLKEFFNFEKDFFKKDNPDEFDVKEELVTIKIHFINLKNKGKNKAQPETIFLPEKFWVSRKFKRNAEYSDFSQDSSIITNFKKEKGDAYTEGKTINPSLQKQLTDFIDSIQYHYIPAIKDKAYFVHLYGELQQTLWKAKISSVQNKQKSFQDSIQETTQALMKEFKDIVASSDTAFVPLFELPHDLVDIFKTLSINTGKVDLTLRGDGIQAKLIPEILYFIALQEKLLTPTKIKVGQKAKKHFIWGFEEPENSYEYKNAQILANRFKDFFSQEAQIFISTHSFNFISIEGENVSTYRVWRDHLIESSRIVKISNKLGKYIVDNGHKADDYESLQEELGVFELNRKLEEIYLQIDDKKKLLVTKEKELDQKIMSISTPIVISEGKNRAYLEVAKRFFLPDLEFEILDQQELGDQEIAKLFNFLLKTQNKLPKKLFIVDCDSTKVFNAMASKETEFLKPFRFEQNTENKKIPKGIENLFSDTLFESRFYPIKESAGDYGAINRIQTFDKNAFELFICNERNLREDFEKFGTLFEVINSYFNNIPTQEGAEV